MQELNDAFLKAWSGETSVAPVEWNANNPAFGQCAVTSCIARDLLGGKIVRVAVKDHYLFSSHFYNELEDGTELDFTFQQFSGNEKFGPKSYKQEGYTPSHPETKRRYELLKKKVEEELLKRKRSI